MDKVIEENFVKRFIVRSKRDRVLYELHSPNKRSHIIQKISEFMNDNFIVFCEKKVSTEKLLSEIKRYTEINNMCYVIGDCSDDGHNLRFIDAFNNMMDSGREYIIICENNTVIIKEEDPIAFLPDKTIYHRAII